MSIRDLPANLILGVRNLRCRLASWNRAWVTLNLRGSFPERRPSRPSIPFPLNRYISVTPETSLEETRQVFERLAAAGWVSGVIVRLEELDADLTALDSLRSMVLDLRAGGKPVIAWLGTISLANWFLASACSSIVMPPSGRVSALGLRAEVTFLRDTLALAGIEADLEAIGEYKSAPDTFRRSEMAGPHREMLDAILDSLFDQIVDAIADGRGLAPADVRRWIDAMPLLPGEALSAGLVDAVLYEDELPGFCCARETPADGMPRSSGSEALSSTTNGRPGFLTWHEAEGRLRRPVRWTTRQRVGVVAVEGMIIPGRSRRFPAPIPLVNRMAGAVTIVQRLRAAEADKRIAAVVLYVDSPGGAALESDLIWREVRRLRSRKPVVVLMGAQAASGGYYVAASANWIVCRPATLTGSIGIWGGKPVIGGLLDRLQVRTEVVQRGSMAGMYSAVTRFAPEERARVERDQRAFYDRFKAVVAEGRNMTETQIEAAARGRVWTGAQALDVGLVDQLGGFQDALEKAKELAGIAEDVDITVVSVSSPQHARLPASFEPDETGGVSRVFSDMWSLWATPRLWALAPWVAVIR